MTWLIRTCDLPLSPAWHDSCAWHLTPCLLNDRPLTFITRLVHTFEMTYPHAWHDSFTREKGLIHVGDTCDMTHMSDACALPSVWQPLDVCDMMIHTCHMTQSHVRHDSCEWYLVCGRTARVSSTLLNCSRTSSGQNYNFCRNFCPDLGLLADFCDFYHKIPRKLFLPHWRNSGRHRVGPELTPSSSTRRIGAAARPGVFRSFVGGEGTTFVEFHGTNRRILRAVLDLARSSGRNSSFGQNLCRSNLIPWRIHALIYKCKVTE